MKHVAQALKTLVDHQEAKSEHSAQTISSCLEHIAEKLDTKNDYGTLEWYEEILSLDEEEAILSIHETLGMVL